MSDELQLPHAARVFVSFVALLRANGFAVAPEQTTAFLAAIELLGPRSLETIRQAGLATLAPPPERRATYDRLFDIHFLGSEAIDRAGAEDEEVVRLQEEGRGEDETLLADEANESGLAAARAEALVERRFAASATGDALPAWLSFNATTQRFIGIPQSSDLGSQTLQLSVSDPVGGTPLLLA